MAYKSKQALRVMPSCVSPPTLALEILRERATICQFLQLSVTFNLGRDSGYFYNDSRIQMRVKFPLLCTLVGDIQLS